MDSAPLFSELAEGPENGSAWWLRCVDGVRIRAAFWPLAGARGTVLLFPGRTEYIEKYGRAAADFAARGYQTVTVDWRGQGLADRVAINPALGHVNRFSDYQSDVQTLLAALPDMGVTSDLPMYLLGHSMGGAIGLRALHRGLPVAAAAFSGPMWGIALSPILRPVAWTLSSAAHLLHRREAPAPGTSAGIYVLEESFENNKLTHDAEMFEYMCRHARAHPELLIGGPTLGWLNEALREMRTLAGMPSPNVPAVTFLGDEESIVSPQRIRDRMGAWPDGTLEILPRTRHEAMMEGPEIRARFFDTCAQLFAAQQGTSGTAQQSA